MTAERLEPQDILPPGVTERRITIEVDAESLEGLRKKAQSSAYGGFTMYSDEGEGSADPPPMVYFAATVLF